MISEGLETAKLNALMLKSQQPSSCVRNLDNNDQLVYYFEVWITEFKKYNNETERQIILKKSNLAPQDLLIQIFEGKLSLSSRETLQTLLSPNFFKNDLNECVNWLINLVTPYEERQFWVERKSLIKYKKKLLIVKLTLIDMMTVLNEFPGPQWLMPLVKREIINIKSPHDFVFLVNKIIDRGMGNLLNLWPYVHRKELYINKGGFYELDNDNYMKLIPSECFDHTRKDEQIPNFSFPVLLLTELEKNIIQNKYLVYGGNYNVKQKITLYLYALINKHRETNPRSFHIWPFMDIPNNDNNLSIIHQIENFQYVYKNNKKYRGILFPLCYQNTDYSFIIYNFINKTICIYAADSNQINLLSDIAMHYIIINDIWKIQESVAENKMYTFMLQYVERQLLTINEGKNYIPQQTMEEIIDKEIKNLTEKL